MMYSEDKIDRVGLFSLNPDTIDSVLPAQVNILVSDNADWLSDSLVELLKRDSFFRGKSIYCVDAVRNPGVLPITDKYDFIVMETAEIAIHLYTRSQDSEILDKQIRNLEHKTSAQIIIFTTLPHHVRHLENDRIKVLTKGSHGLDKIVKIMREKYE